MSAVKIPQNEIRFQVSRSSGPGGQNVNKVNSKATLYWDYLNSNLLDLESQIRFREKFANKITSEDLVMVSSESSRDLKRNQEICLEKLTDMIREARLKPKKRVKTKPKTSAVMKRLSDKKHQQQRKKDRKFDW